MTIRPDRTDPPTSMQAPAWAGPARLGPAELHEWLRSAAADGTFLTRAGARRLLDDDRPAVGDEGWLERCAYVIRPARPEDLPALEALETLCWEAGLRATSEELSARLRHDDHHVLELGGAAVGVIYSQRIAASEAVFDVDFRRAAALRREDGPVRQLLAINIDPAAQSRGLGDALLEFALQLAAFEPGVERICGVTRCGARHRPDTTLAQYVAARDADGLPVDPILAFHAAHGARIGPVVEGYRPPDGLNGGAGVLVEYDPRARLMAMTAAAAADGPVQAVVEGAIRELMPDGQAFDPDRPLRELGFDSFRLVRLRAVLARRLGRVVRPTLFFRHSSSAALVEFFEGPSTARRPRSAAPSVDAVAVVEAPVRGDPIAIVGMSCRLPGGVRDPDGFWTLLEEGRDAISRIPADRFGGPPTDAPDFGGYLDDIAGFDAAFFRIAPVEAKAMDPQQRLLLEAHWQALEHAGIDPTALEGADAGIFVGVFAEDYKLLQARRPESLSTYFGTGTANSIAAGRIAYVLGTRGPAMVVDTACSSSLVAVHQAVRSLRSGESTLALASGVNLILSPELNTVFARAGMLASDGRCKTFDAAADGYVRSEGCGVVVLERLSSARANRRQVLGLIRGTAVNQDGASNGLTAPDGAAQEAVIRKALADAELAPGSIDYVEAHGTGTPLGDPIEVEALDAVHGAERPDGRPLVVGSVKTNIGHTESAAGIAGLIKTVLSLGRGRIPGNLHCRTLNPLLAKARVQVSTETLDWPRGEAPRRAGVSSFGFSGTNAHVILEEAPGDIPRSVSRSHQLLTLSARTPAALQALVERTARALAALDGDALADIAGTSHRGRAHHAHRLAVVGDSLAGWAKALAADDPQDAPSQGVVTTPPAVAFLFTGQGAQYLDMGRALYETQPVFRDRLDRCEAVAREALGRSLIELLYPEAEPSHDDLMTDHPCGQSVNYAVEAALADVWRDWGIEPAAVLGHSLGDFAAAYCAGVFALEDGLRLVIERGRLMSRAAGRMAAVRADEQTVDACIAGLDGVTIGVINGPRSLVISGRHGAVDAALERLRAAGIDTKILDIPVAAHSPMLDPVLDAFEAAVAGIELRAPTGVVISGMTGTVEHEALTTPAYWRAHLRRTVRFADGVATAVRLGCGALLEVGPRSTLLGLAEAVIDDLQTARPTLLASLDPGRDDWQQMLASLGELYVRGAPIRWAAVDGPFVARMRGDALPTYPFERQRFWLDDDPAPAMAVDVDRLRARLRARGLAEAAIEPVLQAIEAERAATDGLARANARLTRIEWSHHELDARVDVAGPWLVLGGGSSATLSVRLEADCEALDGDWRAGFERWLAAVRSAPGGVVYLAPGGGDPLDGAALCGDVLHIAQRMAATECRGRLWLVTRGAQAVDGSVTAPGLAALWGMGRSLALEQPAQWGGLIDLDPDAPDPAAEMASLVAPLCAGSSEDQWVLRGGRWFVPRLVPAALPARSEPLVLRPEAGYLITGGLGNVGLRCARWLVQRGARRLVLTSRRGADTEARKAAVDALRTRGIEVRVEAVDAADADGMARLFAALDADGVSLRGIIHGAGIARFVDAVDAGREDFAAALRPKLHAALILHRLTAERALDFFVCQTSGAGIWGGRAQTHYAAANHALDGLMSWRRAQELPGQAIAWGLWAGGGVVDPETRARLTAGGLRPMGEAETSAILDRLVGDPTAGEAVAADIDWDRLAGLLSLQRPRPLLERLATHEGQTDPGPAADGETPTLVSALRAMPRSRRRERLAEHLESTLARILGLSSSPERRVGFRDLGLDSIMALDLRRALERSLGCALPATIAFEFPTVERLTTHLLGRLALEEGVAPSEPQTGPLAIAEGIAVVSVACRFPGAENPDAFWSMLVEGRDAVGEIPASRGRLAETIRYGACLDDVEGFDAAAFGISPREAAAIDPQHRLLLEVGWEAVERAGLWGPDLAESRTGIFVGIGTESGGDLTHAAAEDIGAYALTGSSHNAAPGRLAHLLGVQGPVMAVDTACSSSLVALHLACRSLRTGECDRALAGGVSLMLSETTAAALGQMQVLAPDGRCKTFDAAADGYGRGEGCGVVVLERLADARAAGRQIIAVVRGSAVNHDGTSSGLTVPNPQAQQRLVRAALDDAGLAPDAVGYVEAHGTGTPLGDPIEVRALAEVFECRSRPLAIGTVKTNIGHLEAASGIAGFIKTALAVRHGQLPAHLHFETPSPHIDGLGTRFEVPTALRPWPTPGLPVAGVSSFGISGTNAHVIVAAPSDAHVEDRPAAEPMAHLLPLSARSAEALSGLADRYLAHLAAHPAHDISDLCHAAATGRRHLSVRAAVVADDGASLRAALDGLALGGLPTAGGASKSAWLFTGQGAQSVGMGRRLYATCPAFRAALDDCAARLAARGVDLFALIGPDGDPARLEDTGNAQPALFALEVALARTWLDWGIEPVALMGHSLGEIAAATIAGVFDLDDALDLLVARGRLMSALPRAGRMAALTLPVALTADDIQRRLAERADVELAAINGPDSVVVSGVADAVEAIVAALVDEGARARALRVSHAFHSPLMDAMLDDFRVIAEGISYHMPTRPFFSALTGAAAGPEVTTVDYWVRHVRAPVRFADALHAALASSPSALLEIGPHPTLLGMAGRLLDGRAEAPQMLPSLRRGRDDRETLLGSLGALYRLGADIDWRAVYAGTRHRPVTQPTYAFQRRRYPLRGRARPGAAVDLHALVEALPLDRLGPAARAALPEIVALMASTRRSHAIDTIVDDWLYAPAWQPAGSTAPSAPGRWLVLGGGEAGVALVKRLRAAGFDAIHAISGDNFMPCGDGIYRVDRRAPDAMGALLDATRPAHIVDLAALDCPALDATGDLLPAAEALCGGLARLVQALAERRRAPRLWLLTRGARAVRPGDRVDGVVQSLLGGLLPVLSLEHPELRPTVVDLDAIDADGIDALAELLRAPPIDEDSLALRDGTPFVERLTRDRRRGAVPAIRGDASYLVVGGTGGLGLQIAGWLAEQGAGHVVLMARGAPKPAAGERIAAWRAAGARISVARADVGDGAAVAAALETIEPPLAGVVHAATARDGGALLTAYDGPRFAQMLAPKLLGAAHLHRLTADHPLDFFVCFSSLSAVFGDLGLSAYVAANAFLDGLAHHRRARGLPATTIDWGIWSDVGAAVDMAGELDRMTRRGHGRIAPDHGVAAFARLLGAPAAQVLAAPVDWARFAEGPAPRRFERLLPAAAPEAASAPTRAEPSTAGDPRAAILAEVLTLARAVLALAPDAPLGPGDDLLERGLDSLMAVELRDALRARYGGRIALADILHSESSEAIVDRLLDAVETGEAPIAREEPQVPEDTDEDLDEWEEGEL